MSVRHTMLVLGTASLIDVERDTSLWSERFDGTLDDVFDMQDRVAESIVRYRSRRARHPRTLTSR